MQHLYLYSWLALIGLLCSCQAEPHNDHVDLHLKGKVKELRLKRYKAVEKSGRIAKGRQVSRTLDKPQLYEYEGLPANSKVSFGEDKAMDTLEMYDSKDELVSKVLLQDTVFQMYNREGLLGANVVVDDRWYPKKMSVYRGTGELLEYTLIEYAEDNPLNRIHREYNKEGQLMAETRYEYDEQERLKRVDTQVNQRSYHRLKKEHKIETITYDKHNHPATVTIDNGSNTQVIKIEYILDEQGNWVQSIEYVNGKPSRFIERTLVYY